MVPGQRIARLGSVDVTVDEDPEGIGFVGYPESVVEDRVRFAIPVRQVYSERIVVLISDLVQDFVSYPMFS